MGELAKKDEGFDLNYEFFQNFKSEHTARAYRNDVASFAGFLRNHFPEVKNAAAIRVSHVIAFRDNMAKNHSPNTVARKLSSVSSYFKFLAEKEIMPSNPAANVKRPSANPINPTEALDLDEIKALWARVKEVGNPMHLLAIDLLMTTGIRREELVKIKLHDIRKKDDIRYIYIVGKGGKQVNKVITERSWKLIQEWKSFLAEKNSPVSPKDFLFQSLKNPGNPLRSNSIYKVVKKYAKEAGINKEITPHSFRASYITQSLAQGISLAKVQQDVGHSSPETTARYSRLRNTLADSPARSLAYLKDD